MIAAKSFYELNNQELYQILRLRSEVFVVEQDCVYQDLDNKDQISIHIFQKEKDEIVAYTRIFKSGDYYKNPSIGRVVVSKKNRGKELGKKIMIHSIEYIKSEKNHFIAKLEAVNDIESISKLTNSKIFILKDDLPDLKSDEFYWHELIGMNVVSSISKKLLGKVYEIRNFGSNDTLIIRANDHDNELLVPFVKDKIIHKIDKDNLTIYAEWETEY